MSILKTSFSKNTIRKPLGIDQNLKTALKKEITMETIGETAGQIWEYLDRKGESTLAKMSKELDLDTNFTQMGIGWLAREGKVEMSKKGTSTNVRLV